MLHGAEYLNKDIVYTIFQKHNCPECSGRLKLITRSKIVNSNSPEAKNYNFVVNGRTHVRGDMKFSRAAFKCKACGKEFEISEIEKFEGVDKADYKPPLKNKIITILLEVGMALIFIGIFVLFFWIKYK